MGISVEKVCGVKRGANKLRVTLTRTWASCRDWRLLLPPSRARTVNWKEEERSSCTPLDTGTGQKRETSRNSTGFSQTYCVLSGCLGVFSKWPPDKYFALVKGAADTKIGWSDTSAFDGVSQLIEGCLRK